MLDLISIHIAKTGGRSFFEILKDQYGESLDPRYKRVHYFPKKNYNNKLINRIPENIEVIHGHLYYEHIEEIHKKYQPKIITWFRNPVDRVISNYYYLMRRLREDNSHPLYEKRNHTLLEYADDSIKNKMFRYLEGIDLDELFFFGFLEEYDEGVNILSKMLSWKNPIQKHHINEFKPEDSITDIATPRESITQKMREEIKQLNQNDAALYLKAKELYKIKFYA